MDQKEEEKFLTDLNRTILKHKIIYFLKDYKRSIPWLLFILLMTLYAGSTFFLISSDRLHFVEQNLSSADSKFIRVIGCGFGIMIWLFSAIPWSHLEFFDASTREFIFPSPIRRRTIVLQRIKKYYIYTIIGLVPGSFLVIYFFIVYKV
ncbi:MAG: hypothetical protein KAJ51_15345, partial [Thermoplasmata archaeon]|nr:hypothetical protein [Thermoplasmata archaeon]